MKKDVILSFFFKSNHILYQLSKLSLYLSTRQGYLKTITTRVHSKLVIGKESGWKISRLTRWVHHFFIFNFIFQFFFFKLNPFLSFFFNFIIYHLVDFELVFIFLFRFVFYEVISISNKHLRIWLVLNFFSVYFYFIISLSENIF